ncbi:TolC family protein [Helicobacter didelphidarum]|nr:TolC family protein [Helicobacter didelphidarum]
MLCHCSYIPEEIVTTSKKIIWNPKQLYKIQQGFVSYRINLNIMILFSIIYTLFTACAKLPTENTLIDKTHIRNNFNNKLYNLDSKKQKEDSAITKLNYQDTFFMIFTDPILQKIVIRALESNANLLTLESAITQARATSKANTANLLPKVNAGVNYNYSDNNYKSIQTTIMQNTANANLSMSWEIDILGKINALRMASDQNILAAIENLTQAQVVLMGDVANYYFTIRQIQQAIILNEEIAKNLEEIYKLTQERYNLGLIGLDSLATTKSNYLTQKNTTLNLIAMLEQNKNALLVLLNSNDIGFDVADSYYEFTIPQIPSVNAMPTDVIFNRPDVRSSVFALNASIYQRYNKKMALYPSISLNGNLGQILMSPQRGIGDVAWQIASSLAMPLINRQSITQDYIIAKENTKQAFYSLQNTINTALSEIENAIKNMEITQQSRDNNIQSYDINKNTFEIMESRYNEKLIDDVSRLEYANTYLRAKNSLLSAHLSENQAAIALYKAFGGDFNPDEFKENTLQKTKVPKEQKKHKKDIADDL